MSILSTILWHDRAGPNFEYCTLRQATTGFRFEGVVLTVTEQGPTRVDYDVRCDTLWQTRTVNAQVTVNESKRRLSLSVDEEQRWWSDGNELELCRGCIDVDLGFTPATNTLPIRRLGLDIGERAETTAAWMRFPSLVIQPYPQRYIRLDENRYLYESLTSGYTAELVVNEVGVVVDYEGYWQQVEVPA